MRFFFSSRRRHTRCLSDWSSNVCSSDLFGLLMVSSHSAFSSPAVCNFSEACSTVDNAPPFGLVADFPGGGKEPRSSKIGRASCRERVKTSGGRELEENKRDKTRTASAQY